MARAWGCLLCCFLLLLSLLFGLSWPRANDGFAGLPRSGRRLAQFGRSVGGVQVALHGGNDVLHDVDHVARSPRYYDADALLDDAEELLRVMLILFVPPILFCQGHDS